MIYNIRGTNGSGKSWVARQIISRCGGIVEPILSTEDGAILGHICKNGLRVLGKYIGDDAGGFDNTPKAHRGFDELFARLDRYGAKPGRDVLVEGLTLSTDFHRTLPLVKRGFMKIWYLNRSLGDCKQYLKLRRQKAGKPAPRTFEHLVSKFRGVELNRAKFKREGFNFPHVSPEAAVEEIWESLLAPKLLTLQSTPVHFIESRE